MFFLPSSGEIDEEDNGGTEDQVMKVEKGRELCVFREELKQTFGDQEVLPNDSTALAKKIRDTGRKRLGVSTGMREADVEICW